MPELREGVKMWNTWNEFVAAVHAAGLERQLAEVLEQELRWAPSLYPGESFETVGDVTGELWKLVQAYVELDIPKTHILHTRYSVLLLFGIVCELLRRRRWASWGPAMQSEMVRLNPPSPPSPLDDPRWRS